MAKVIQDLDLSESDKSESLSTDSQLNDLNVTNPLPKSDSKFKYSKFIIFINTNLSIIKYYFNQVLIFLFILNRNNCI